MIYPITTLQWLAKLISFDTTSRHSNLALIDYINQFCQSLNLTPRLSFNLAKNKANLFVSIPANDNNVKTGGFVFSGHTDVVPVDGQAWDSDPFVAVVKEGKVYGRGACDMKGFIACCLAILPNIVKLSVEKKLTKPIHLALSFDEEIGCLGMPFLLTDLQNQGIMPDYCIVGEPTMMKMVTAHKGIQTFRCRVQGKAAHSSLTEQGVNAISYASQVIGFIDDLAEKLKQQELKQQESKQQESKPRDLVQGFDVPFSTLSVGMIKGGIATNIIPDFCEFSFDFRNLPHVLPTPIIESIRDFVKTLSEQMQNKNPNCYIELIQDCQVPAMNDKESLALQRLIENLVDDKRRHKVAYATEGGQFTNFGVPTLICGCGDIAQAHKANEFVSIEQLNKCEQFLINLVTMTAVTNNYGN
ncbi:acetylornithine deacetylase [Moraxella macacae 0408225]|uniref:Acetylornithine deacetylase n=1 Tax=Moraxella macacae 0408225 TaxID=1230338 RepID=L2F9L9_9GAMM|nr:acetylornithine deacetylase [Moraxella macacae]ELA09769.1 acetylornithine deacetylase [Moraxella macacae 0408225]